MTKIHIAKSGRSNGYGSVRDWIDGRAVDESAHTRNESAAESQRLKREIEINAGIQPIRHADVGELVETYREAMPPRTSALQRAALHVRLAARYTAELGQVPSLAGD